MKARRKPLVGHKKRAVLCGITGFGATLREAREDALRQAGKTLDRLRDDSVPRIVAWCGFIGIVYRDIGGVNYAVIADPSNEVCTGQIQACTLCAPETSMADAERELRQYLAQLAWSPDAGTEPPEILEDEKGRGEFHAWAKWQTAYADATQNGASDEETRRITNEFVM